MEVVSGRMLDSWRSSIHRESGTGGRVDEMNREAGNQEFLTALYILLDLAVNSAKGFINDSLLERF
jgi:hypothetical protein